MSELKFAPFARLQAERTTMGKGEEALVVVPSRQSYYINRVGKSKPTPSR